MNFLPCSEDVFMLGQQIQLVGRAVLFHEIVHRPLGLLGFRHQQLERADSSAAGIVFSL